MEFSKYWSPKLIVQNVISSSKDNVWKKLEFGKNGEAFIVEKRRIKGIFTENLELHDFPFDLQVFLHFIHSFPVSMGNMDLVLLRFPNGNS